MCDVTRARSKQDLKKIASKARQRHLALQRHTNGLLNLTGIRNDHWNFCTLSQTILLHFILLIKSKATVVFTKESIYQVLKNSSCAPIKYIFFYFILLYINKVYMWHLPSTYLWEIPNMNGFHKELVDIYKENKPYKKSV